MDEWWAPHCHNSSRRPDRGRLMTTSPSASTWEHCWGPAGVLATLLGVLRGTENFDRILKGSWQHCQTTEGVQRTQPGPPRIAGNTVRSLGNIRTCVDRTNTEGNTGTHAARVMWYWQHCCFPAGRRLENKIVEGFDNAVRMQRLVMRNALLFSTWVRTVGLVFIWRYRDRSKERNNVGIKKTY